MGVGNEFDGDDAAGLLAAQLLERRIAAPGGRTHVTVIQAGLAPENFTGQLRKLAPQVVLILDAAWSPDAAWRVTRLDAAALDGFGASTHMQPLSRLAGYLEVELGCAVGLIGIRAEQVEFGRPLSPEVRHACHRLARELGEMLA
jgi:hydrogenase 3 maturation protease